MSQMDMKATEWKKLLSQQIPLLGHRNWIGVVDAAYPWQTAPGIETVSTGSEHLYVLAYVFEAIRLASHLRPVVRLDSEFTALSETMVPGIDPLRKQMNHLLQQDDVAMVPHEEIISKLDAAARIFRVLLFKTTLTLPYTSVFIELDCGYWSADREQALRTAFSKLS